MAHTAKIRKRLADSFKDLKGLRGFAPPVIANCLYDSLIISYMKGKDLLNYDIRVLMIVSVFQGLNRNKIITMSGMHHQTLYAVFARLEENGYIYADSCKPKGIYLTEGGKEVVTDVSRLWAEIVRMGARRLNEIKMA